MFNRLILKKEHIIPALFTSFFCMSSLFLLFSGQISLYHIMSLDVRLFIWQLVVFIILFIIIYIYLLYIKHIELIGVLISSIFIFAIIFLFKSPVLSLRVGVLIFTIPLIYINMRHTINRRYHPINIYTLNSIIYGCLLLIFIVLYRHSAFNELLFNSSQISEVAILPANGEQYIVYSIPLLIVLLLLFIFNRFQRENKSTKLEIGFIIILTLIEVVALSIFMIYRTKAFYTSTFDFGIYAQMFYNMKNLNGMVTTLERSMLLSHNAVHVSPIYYLMLPVYMIFPYLETLQVLQVIIVSIGVIPLYLIAKSFNLNRTVIVIAITMYLFHPAILSSSYYDLHENCFLGPLLLFLIYFGLKKQYLYVGLFAILTLMVKEDASLYIVFIGLFFLFTHPKSKKDTIMSLLLVFIPIGYFLSITSFINHSGDGAMFWRYDNLQAYPDLGALGIPITIFQNPGYWFATMFSPEKIYHLIVILLCLGFIPLFNKRFSYYWLVLPLFIFNLSSIWPYQHLFGYQYYYGSVTLLIFMFLLAFKDHQIKQSKVKSLTSYGIALIALVTLLSIGTGVLMINMKYVTWYETDQSKYESMVNTLVQIPEESSVVASSYITPYLSQREIIYDINYYDLESSDMVFDYIVLDNWRQYDLDLALKSWLETNGYERSPLSTNQIIIYTPT